MYYLIGNLCNLIYNNQKLFQPYRAKLSAPQNILALGNNHKLLYHSHILHTQAMNIEKNPNSRSLNQININFIDFL